MPVLFPNACPAPTAAPVQTHSVALKRRSFLGTAALSAGGLMFTPRLFASSLDLTGLPKAWTDRQGSNLKGYSEFLQDLKLKRVSILQVLQAHAKCRAGTWNDLPPKVMWKNLGPTLKTLDMVASELDQPVRQITSAYRSPAYNAKCPGAKKGSWHQKNYALDVQFAASPSTVTAAARRLRNKGRFKGGIGRYSSFTHIDTRGVNASW